MNIYDPNKAFSTSHNDPPDQSPQMHSPARQMFSRLLANVLIEQDAALRAALPAGGYALPAKTNHQLQSSIAIIKQTRLDTHRRPVQA
ncbi:hypothetical protein [Enterobacter cloacae]|uniref:hypothetical protein n=1 Tax=Enterobacter cloacae TaxID=550 RepID=UPI0012B5F817|nr:hypothetical protein [Enterobacter cloacae]MDE7634624.1 hypothetical protein [Enterobacter cloacae]HAS1231495.1 hypothetical protein [Enterobacter cloacae]HAS1236983.1 hypothetical protein [Enterobacter cloacae]HBN6007046.1 hypothetical protein [Enterobacter cloacae]HED1596507.1 hypothetical protein [Enterobacter cloacae subsp. cloacae]